MEWLSVAVVVLVAAVAFAVWYRRRGAQGPPGVEAAGFDTTTAHGRALAAALREGRGAGPLAPSPGASAAPWTDFRLPTVPGWDREPPRDFGPAQGVSACYRAHGGGVTASLYVYDHGEGPFARDGAVMRAELDEARNGLLAAANQGLYASVRFAGAPMPVAMGAATGYRQRAVLTLHTGQEAVSDTYVTTHRGFFVKIRLTLHRPPDDATERAIAALADAVGSASLP